MNWILDKLLSFGDQEAIVTPEGSISYKELSDKAAYYVSYLKDNSINQGESVALIGDFSVEIVAMMIALMVKKCTVVPLTNETENNHQDFFKLSNVHRVLSYCESTKLFISTTNDNRDDHAFLQALRSTESTGLVLFTSGTSGKSKGAVLNFSRLLEKYNRSSAQPKCVRALVFLKLDHIGGINTLFAILMTGGVAISLTDRSVASVCRMVESHGVELLPTTPTFLNMLLISGMHKEFNLSSLTTITYGTEPMPRSTLSALHNTFPTIKLKQTYGLTELGILSTQSKSSGSDWVKIGGAGVNLKVVDNILFIKTSTAMLGYLNAPSPFSEDGWYNTGDRVEVDGDYYRILGRESEIINVGGEKVYPAEVESVLLEMSNISEVLVQGKRSPVTGQLVIARVVLEVDEPIFELQARVIAYCRERLEEYKIPKLVLVSQQSFMSNRLKKARQI